eukprot:1835712-Pyramimonas_sp.AAC.1
MRALEVVLALPLLGLAVSDAAQLPRERCRGAHRPIAALGLLQQKLSALNRTALEPEWTLPRATEVQLAQTTLQR